MVEDRFWEAFWGVYLNRLFPVEINVYVDVSCRNIALFASSDPRGEQLIVPASANKDSSSSNSGVFASGGVRMSSLLFAQYYCVRKIICLLYETVTSVRSTNLTQ